jgi:putative acetyltransferase
MTKRSNQADAKTPTASPARISSPPQRKCAGDPATMPLVIAQAAGAAGIAAARELLERYAAALPFSLDYQDFTTELAGLPAPYAPPHGALLLAKRHGDAVGTVGLKRLGNGVAEIKRLYVTPDARGLGIGKALLLQAIDEARRKGYARTRLDSHRGSMQAAIALYLSLGFIEIPPYGPDLDGEMAFFEIELSI